MLPDRISNLTSQVPYRLRYAAQLTVQTHIKRCIVFQSYQDYEWMIMTRLCAVEPRFTIEKVSPRVGLELVTTRSVGQRLTH